jgi:hypothetical protein
MKNICFKNVLLMITGAIVLSSCYKSFDPKSYQPVFTIGGYASSADVGAGHLVGYWAFDGNYVDSVSGEAATPTGTGFGTGFKGECLQGADKGYVLASAPDGIKNLHSFTVVEWVNTPPPSTGIIDIFTLSNTTQFWGNIEIFFENGSSNSNGKLRVHVNQDGGDHTYSVDGLQNLFDKWINLAVSYDESSSTFKVFINGTEAASGTAGVNGPLSFDDVGDIVFGASQFQTTPSQTSATGAQSWAGFLTGQIDEARVYDTPLAASDLQALIILQGKGK